jgi:metabolite-proton symporter
MSIQPMIEDSIAPPVRSDARRVAIASAVGTTIEWYDFFIYGTAAATVFAPRFFPQVSPVAGTLAAFATFGAGFVARPIGGIVMGHFGDRVGRKSMLVWSLMLMGLATLGIGLLPDYGQIGLWAPALLLVCRLVQGFALGGEWGGAVLMSIEHAPEARRGYYGSIVALGLPAGIILSNAVFLGVSLAAVPKEFEAWGWRVPFLASAILVGVGLFIRVGLAESPEFDDISRRNRVRRTPVLDVVRGNLRAVLLAAGSYVGISTLGYLVLFYYVSYATRVLRLPLPTVLTLLLVAACTFAVAVVAFARWSDRVGRRRVMLWGNAALVAWAALFFPLLDTGSAPIVALALCGMLIIQGAYIGTQPAVFAELFPAAVRYSGTSLANTLGTIVGGAPAPFIAAALYEATGTSLAIGAYGTALAIVSFLSTMALGHERPAPSD